MKFFTPELIARFYDDEDDGDFDAYLEASEAYRQHLASLKDVLPDRVLELAEPHGHEDGLIVRVIRAGSDLTLVIRCGNIPAGYFDLVLNHRSATISLDHDRTLARIARTTYSDRRHEENLRYQELDVAPDGGIEHRMIFTNASWFAIRCRSLDWERMPRPDRKLPRHRDRYPGAPDIL